MGLLKTEQNSTPILALKNKGKIGTGFEGLVWGRRWEGGGGGEKQEV